MIANGCDCGWKGDLPNPNCERCRLVYFFRQTVRMRTAQRAYFDAPAGGRTAAGLEEAKKAERWVDKMIARFTEIQPALFDLDA
jgi:hypothetical protein